jgi:hypothetical protein
MILNLVQRLGYDIKSLLCMLEIVSHTITTGSLLAQL